MSEIFRLAEAARRVSASVAHAGAAARTRAILAIADAMEAHAQKILAANRQDVAAASEAGLAPAMIDRLTVDAPGLAKMVAAVRAVAALPDPIGAITKSLDRDNGLHIEKRRIPLGVIAMIYESRPNVTTDAAALCLRAGNATILRGGKEAFASNTALATAIEAGLAAANFPTEAVQLFATTDHAALKELLQLSQFVDLVIPRGGEGLIRMVTAESKIPVIQHYRGNCHVYVERTANMEMALQICRNAKVSRPGVCNAAESILIDKAIAKTFLPALVAKLPEVELRADAAARAIVPALKPATDADMAAEFLDLVCSVAIVDDIDAAIAHIRKFGSNHSEAIVTTDDAAAQKFVAEVDSSTVLVNASTRFADGGELGLGAEIGISTTRLHAYGPMGAEELTTTKFVVLGSGQIRN